MAGNTASGSFASYTTRSGRAVFGMGSTVRSACDSAAWAPDIMASTNAVAATVTRPKDFKQDTADTPFASRSIPNSPIFLVLIHGHFEHSSI